MKRIIGASSPSYNRPSWVRCSTQRWRGSAISRGSGSSCRRGWRTLRVWVSACGEALGMRPGGLAALPAASRIVPRGLYRTVAELHTRLDSMVSDVTRRSVRWPKAPNGLGNALRRMATNLRAAGVELQFSRNDVLGRRMVSVIGAAQVWNTSSVAVSSRQ